MKGCELTRIAHVPTAHFRISEEHLEQARKAAEADRRTLSNWLGLVVERALEDKFRDTATADSDQRETTA